MKRIIPFLLVLLLVPCMVLPASASTVDAIEDQSFWLMGDLGWFDDADGALGAIFYAISDGLIWLDASVRDVETAVKSGFSDTTKQLTAILEQIYTNGTLTIGEYVKSIRSYLVDIDTKLETGVEETVGQLVNSIYDYLGVMGLQLSNIQKTLSTLVSGDTEKADAVSDSLTNIKVRLDFTEMFLQDQPAIDDSAVDQAVSGVGGKFQNITSDADGTLLFGALGEIAGSNIFSQLIPTSAMLGVLSFALFGRVF